jgi:hypothetical protein
MTLHFLSVQLFTAIAITLLAVSFRLEHPSRMKWKPPPVGVTFDRLKQQLINPYEGE